MILPLLPVLLPVALGQPAGLSPEQIEDSRAWEQRARTLLDGPAGCVEMEGTVKVSLRLYRPGGWLSRGEQNDMAVDGSFLGRLDSGTWTSLETTWNTDEQTRDRLKLDKPRPMVGRLPPEPEEAEEGGSVAVSGGGKSTEVEISGSSRQTLNMLDKIIADIDPAVTTVYSRWDEESRAVVLEQYVPLDGRKGDLQVTVTFPEGGPATMLDAVFPASFMAGDGLIQANVRDAQLHLRGQSTALGVLPVEESVSVVVGVMGFTLGLEQRITYGRARACR